MGTDIHGFFQRRPKVAKRDNGFRLSTTKHTDWGGQPHFSLSVDVLGLGDNPNDWRRYGTWQTDHRNYVLFAILANVRNGFGFAGCNIFTPLESLLTEPMDLPDDIRYSPHYKSSSPGYNSGSYDDIWMGEHSHGVLTADEILSYDFQRRLTEFGVVDMENLQLIAAGKQPRDYCGDIWGRGVKKHPRIDMTEGKTFIVNPSDYTHFEVMWDGRELIEYVRDFIDEVRAKVDANPDYDIRIVFGFDS